VQPLGQRRSIGKAALAVAGGGFGNVLAQHLVVDVEFPAGRQRFAEIANNQLVQHDAECIDIGLHRRRLTGQHFRSQIQRRAAAGLTGSQGASEAEPGDAERVEPLRIQHPATAEVGQLDLRAAAVQIHQHVGGLEILVQHADGVGGGQGFGNLRRQLDAIRQQDAVESTLALGPLHEIAAGGVLALDEVRLLLQVPVQDARDPAAAGLAQQARQRDLALERGQRRHIERKLVDALLASLVVAGQPGLAAAATAEALDQAPERPQRRMVARLEAQPRRRRGGRMGRHHIDRGHQAIAVTVNRADDALIVVLQDLAQAADGLGQNTLGQNTPRPAGLGQFVLGDHFAGVMQQVEQHLQRLGLQRGGFTTDTQFKGALIQFGPAELPQPVAAACRNRRLHARPRFYSAL
jgi:hypothetical protein